MSLQNRQLRTTLPATKLQTNSETVKVSPQTRKKHSKFDGHTKELPRILPKQLVRLQDSSSKKWSIPGEVLQKAETPNSYVVKTAQHSTFDGHTKELPIILPKQLVMLQDPSSKKWSIPGEVFQKAETPKSYVVKTPKGVLRRNQIHIKEAAMPGPQVPAKQAPAAAPMAPKQLISKIIQPAKTIEIPRTAAKPPCTQPTGLEKPRVAAMPPSELKPALPSPVPPPPQRIPSVSASKPHPVIQENDRPLNPTGSGNNNKAISKVSVLKSPGPVQVPDKPQDTTKETTTLYNANRVSKPNKRYADTLNVHNIASVVKNNLWLWSKKPPKGTVQMV